jgi:DNA-binding transcriptional ArsR family regulator
MHALDALGNPVRRAILRRLAAGPRSVGEIAVHFSVTRPAISRHLRVLQDAGLVTVRFEGTRSLYSIRAKGFDSVRAYLDDFWGSALRGLESRAKR